MKKLLNILMVAFMLLTFNLTSNSQELIYSVGCNTGDDNFVEGDFTNTPEKFAGDDCVITFGNNFDTQIYTSTYEPIFPAVLENKKLNLELDLKLEFNGIINSTNYDVLTIVINDEPEEMTFEYIESDGRGIYKFYDVEFTNSLKIEFKYETVESELMTTFNEFKFFSTPQIVANDDSEVVYDGTLGQTNLLNVLDNDELNGNPINGGDVELSLIDGDAELSLNITGNFPDGQVDLEADTPDGVYSLRYKICKGTDFGDYCDNATVTVEVGSVIIANNDEANGEPGEFNVVNVLDNDELNGEPVTLETVNLEQTGGDTELTLNEDGSVDVEADIEDGTYTLTYEICEEGDVNKCDQATVTVNVETDVTSIKENTLEDMFKVFSYSNELNVRTTEFKNYNLQVFSIGGRLVFNDSNLNGNFKKQLQESGIYIVKLQFENDILVKKVYIK